LLIGLSHTVLGGVKWTDEGQLGCPFGLDFPAGFLDKFLRRKGPLFDRRLIGQRGKVEKKVQEKLYGKLDGNLQPLEAKICRARPT